MELNAHSSATAMPLAQLLVTRCGIMFKSKSYVFYMLIIVDDCKLTDEIYFSSLLITTARDLLSSFSALTCKISCEILFALKNHESVKLLELKLCI